MLLLILVNRKKMLMNKKDVISREYDIFIELLSRNTTFISDSDSKVIFSRIFFLIYLSRRFETKSFFDSKYFQSTISFLIEGYVSLMKNIPHGSLLLLRSAIENHTKSILYLANVDINERSYGENYKKNLELLTNETFETKNKKISVNKLRTKYSSISAISHSATNNKDIPIYKYFNDVINNISIQNAKDEWLSVLEQMCIYSTYQCSSSFKNWEYFELIDLLSIAFTTNRCRNLAEYFIDGKQF